MPHTFFTHAKALVESKSIGERTRIWAFTHVLSGAKIGRDCNIGEHVFIENHVLIGNGCTIKNGVALWDLISIEDDVFIGPYVVFTNDRRPRAFIKCSGTSLTPTLIKQGATLGANSTIVCGVTVGAFAMIGSGTVVTKNVPEHALFLGNPGRMVAKICYCGASLDSNDFCLKCNRLLSKNSLSEVKRLHSLHNSDVPIHDSSKENSLFE